MEETSIRQLSFGKSIAESERDRLSRYFIPIQAYMNAKSDDRRKTFYIGQRGAGKSALLNKLTSEFASDGRSITVNITPSHFSYELFVDRRHDYIDVRSVYAAVWHYTLVIHLFKQTIAFLSRNTHFSTNKENVAILKSYLIQKGLIDVEGILDVFFTFLDKFSARKVASRVQDITGSQAEKDKQMLKLIRLSDLGHELRAFQNITDSHPIYIFIDELDTGWDNSKEAQNFLYGLFYAVSEIKKLRNITVFVSLRSDMYNNLSSILPDAEKMRDDIERFSWNPVTLKGLIARRVIAFYPGDGLKHATPNQAISEVFEEGVLDYIIAHTLQRPREIIQFCNDCLDEVRNLSLHSITPSKITQEIAETVTPRFSTERLSTFCEEFKYQHPYLKTLLTCFENGPEYYYMEEFKVRLEEAMLISLENIKGLIQAKADEEMNALKEYDTTEELLRFGESQIYEESKKGLWLQSYLDTPKRLIELLFQIGFIKLYSQNDKTYKAFYETTLLNIDNISQLKIHEVFVSALKCRPV
jgi:hypothetical protein